MSLNRFEDLRKCRDIVERVSKLEKNLGVRKAGTPANDPPIPDVEGQRTLLAELLAQSVARGNGLVQSALLRSKGYLSYLAEIEKDPNLSRALIEAVLENDRVNPGPEGISEPIGENYDNEAFAAAIQRAKLLQMGHEIVARPVADILDYRVAKQGTKQVLAFLEMIANHFLAGGSDVSVSAAISKAIRDMKRVTEAVIDHRVQKSATDKSPVDLRELGRPRQIQDPYQHPDRR